MGGHSWCRCPLTLCVVLQVIQAQTFMIRNLQLEKCLHVAEDTGRVSLAKCKVHSHHQQWSWDPSSSSIANVNSNRCLAVEKMLHLPTLRMEACEGRRNQAWACDVKGHLAVYGQALHLNAKQGSKKVFVTSGIDKFSTWRRETGLPVCGETLSRPTHAEQERKEVTDGDYEYKFSNTTKSLTSSPKIPGWVTVPTRSPGPNYTADAGDWPSISPWGTLPEKIYVFEEESSGWKTAMLILSPFTFILGMILLILNVRINKKRKLLYALPDCDKSHHKLGSSYEQSPLTGTTDPTEYPGQDPKSATLRHGEILIEWKDGTITPLYDRQ